MLLKRRVACVLVSRPMARMVMLLTRGIVRSRGLVIDTRTPEVTNATRAALFWRCYESAELRMVASQFRLTSVLIDLGASLGVVTSAAAKSMAPDTEVVCVEANRLVLDLAELNVARNARQVSVRGIHGAIDYTSVPGESVAFTRGESHVGSSLAGKGDRRGFTAPAVRLADIAPADSTFSLLVDIEGAEVGLFLEESHCLARCDQMVIELHDTVYRGKSWTPNEILNLARDLGFESQNSYGNVHALSRTTPQH